MKRIWILNDLFVKPKHRNEGVARALLQKSKEFGMETKAKRLVLQTRMDNTPAQALYKNSGWTKEEKFLTFKLELLE